MWRTSRRAGGARRPSKERAAWLGCECKVCRTSPAEQTVKETEAFPSICVDQKLRSSHQKISVKRTCSRERRIAQERELSGLNPFRASILRWHRPVPPACARPHNSKQATRPANALGEARRLARHSLHTEGRNMCEACAKPGHVPWHTTCRGPGECGAPWMPLLGPARSREVVNQPQVAIVFRRTRVYSNSHRVFGLSDLKGP